MCIGLGIYYSKNSGATWTQSSPNAPTGTGVSLYQIASSSSGQIMAAAVSYGELLNTYIIYI